MDGFVNLTKQYRFKLINILDCFLRNKKKFKINYENVLKKKIFLQNYIFLRRRIKYIFKIKTSDKIIIKISFKYNFK